MFIAACVVSAALAMLLAAFAVGKLRKDKMQMETLTKVGFPHDKAWLLACAEAAGAVGLIVGLWWCPWASPRPSVLSRTSSGPRRRAFYDQHRAADDTHHQAPRALGNRLVGILRRLIAKPEMVAAAS